MSQCHDPYDLFDLRTTEPSRPREVPGTQCHDPAPLASQAPLASRVASAEAVPGEERHGCRMVTEERSGRRVLHVIGHLDWATRSRFTDSVGDLGPGDVVIDLEEATLDSAGTGAVLWCVARATGRGQQIVVVTPDPLQYEVFVSTGLTGVVPVVRSTPEAVNRFADHLAASCRRDASGRLAIR